MTDYKCKPIEKQIALTKLPNLPQKELFKNNVQMSTAATQDTKRKKKTILQQNG